jgi:hypothetical protein
MKPIDRLKSYFDFKRIKPGSVDRAIEVGNGYIGKQLKARASVGSDILEKIFMKYPDLNPVWVLTGRGNMIDLPENGSVPQSAVDTQQVQLSTEEQKKLLQLEIELKEIEMAHLRKKLEILNSFKNQRGQNEL